jgi:hypothetical protein
MHVVLAVPTSFLVGTAVLFGCAEKRKRNRAVGLVAERNVGN